MSGITCQTGQFNISMAELIVGNNVQLAMEKYTCWFHIAH